VRYDEVQAGEIAHAIMPGEQTTFAVQSDGIFSGNITLTLSITPAMNYSIQPENIAVPATATLTLTDTHTGTLHPGIIHIVTVTAIDRGDTQTATARILVGGWRLYLPLILR